MEPISPCLYCYQYDHEAEAQKRRNAYGSIVQDLTTPFCINTERYKFKRCRSCNQTAKNIHQTYWFDYDLPDYRLVNAESDLRNLPRKLSKMPSTRYNPSKPISNLKEGFLPNQFVRRTTRTCAPSLPTNMARNCQHRIVTSYYWDGPQYNPTPNVAIGRG